MGCDLLGVTEIEPDMKDVFLRVTDDSRDFGRVESMSVNGSRRVNKERDLM
jgi:hypothetical protein